MKLYSWKDYNTYPYAGGMVTVVANSEEEASEVAEAMVKQAVYRGSGYDLSSDPLVQEIAPGNGFAYYWEE